MGRPKGTRVYPKKLEDEICERLANGEFLRAICRDEHMPSWTRIYQWVAEDPAFAARVAHARELGFDVMAEEVIRIANTPLEGIETEEEAGRLKVKRSDMLGHRRLQVDTMLRLLAKWCPSKYGDRQQVDLTVARLEDLVLPPENKKA
jgi:hypothetical protein